jgi:hypothetical protein
MNYLLLLIITIFLLAFIVTALSLKSILKKDKINNIRSCKLPEGNNPECGCGTSEKCLSNSK